MFLIPLSNSKLTVEVSEEDYLILLLLGPWNLDTSGYARTNTRPYQHLHRIVANRMNLSSIMEVDHKDRNKANSKRDNLRSATSSEQKINTGTRHDNSSGYKCIAWYIPLVKWRVQIQRNKRKIHVGYYDTIEEAVQQRDAYIKRNNITFIED